MSEKKGIHCFVSGKVQGVWFRASTKTQADQIGVSGFVRNLSDGRVEVMAFGEMPQLKRLLTWLKRGPQLAEVKQVDHQFIDYKQDDARKFEVK